MYNAIAEARKSKNKPTLIRLRTTIGYGSRLQGTHGVHGAPLKPDDAAGVKTRFGFDPSAHFVVPDATRALYAKIGERGAALEADWDKLLEAYQAKYPKEHAELVRRIAGELPQGWEQKLPQYTTKDPAIASRSLSEKVLQAISGTVPELVGGSADLTGSNLTRVKEAVDFQPESTGLGHYSGRYIRYGVREHAMGAIMNGLGAYGGIIPFGGTFLVGGVGCRERD